MLAPCSCNAVALLVVPAIAGMNTAPYGVVSPDPTGDIAGHPVWNLRAKTPQQEQATVPWHQVPFLASARPPALHAAAHTRQRKPLLTAVLPGIGCACATLAQLG